MPVCRTTVDKRDRFIGTESFNINIRDLRDLDFSRYLRLDCDEIVLRYMTYYLGDDFQNYLKARYLLKGE
jgi:hypothetical protein